MSEVLENNVNATVNEVSTAPDLPAVQTEAIVTPNQVVLMPTKVSFANNMVNTAQSMVCGLVLTGVAQLALTGAKAAWNGGKKLLAVRKEKKELKKLAKQIEETHGNAQEKTEEVASEE